MRAGLSAEMVIDEAERIFRQAILRPDAAGGPGLRETSPARSINKENRKLTCLREVRLSVGR